MVHVSCFAEGPGFETVTPGFCCVDPEKPDNIFLT